MNNEETSWLKFSILFPSIFSIFGSLLMSFINFQFRMRQTVLTNFVLSVAVSDFLYTITGLALARGSPPFECPVYWTLIRSFARLTSFCFSVAFALTLNKLVISGITNRMDLDPETVRDMFKWSFLVPFIWIAIFLLFFSHRFLDVICWEGIPSLSEQSILLKYYMELPIIASLIGAIIIHSTTLVFLKRKLEQEGNFNFIKNLYELFIYPFGILLCYFWFFLESLDNENNFIRTADVFFQQSQGFINFLIFGLNYQTRTYIKTYCQKAWTRIYEFFHVTGHHHRSHAIELQTGLLHDNIDDDRVKLVNYL